MINRIVVGTDFNPLAAAALQFGAAIAQRTGAELIVVYADTFDPPAEFTASQLQSIVESIENSKRKTAEELEKHVAQTVPSGVRWKSVVTEELPATGIIRVADEHAADLIVLGTHGRGGLQRLMLGSVAEAVIREAHVPVLTVRSTDVPAGVHKILCTAGNAQAAGGARRIADDLGAELYLGPDLDRDSLLAAADSGEYDLIVICGENKLLTRHARTPVLTLGPRTTDSERRTA